MHCMSLWIKASAKCINVNVRQMPTPVVTLPAGVAVGQCFFGKIISESIFTLSAKTMYTTNIGDWTSQRYKRQAV